MPRTSPTVSRHGDHLIVGENDELLLNDVLSSIIAPAPWSPCPSPVCQRQSNLSAHRHRIAVVLVEHHLAPPGNRKLRSSADPVLCTEYRSAGVHRAPHLGRSVRSTVDDQC